MAQVATDLAVIEDGFRYHLLCPRCNERLSLTLDVSVENDYVEWRGRCCNQWITAVPLALELQLHEAN